MCFMFKCCGPPPHATIKAYDNTTPFALDWYKDRGFSDPFQGSRETAIIDWNDETGYTIGVVSSGAGSEITGSTRETAVVERDADDGDRQTESSSSPLVAAGISGGAGRGTTIHKMAAVSGPFGGFWLWGTTGLATSPLVRFNFFDLDLVQQCNVTFNPAPVSMGIEAGGPVIAGFNSVGGTFASSSTLAKTYNTSGVQTDSLAGTALTVTGGRTLIQLYTTIPRDDTITDFLVFGMERDGSSNQYRQIWVCDKSGLNQSAIGTPVAISGFSEQFDGVNERGVASRSNSTYTVLNLRDGSLVGINRSVPQEVWTKSDKTRQFCCLDSTRVYTADPTAGEISAVALATGVESWTLDLSDEDKLGTNGGYVQGRVLSSGNIAFWKHNGVTIVNTSGTEIATVDVGVVYDIVEKQNRWIIVGAKRTTES